MSGSQQGPGAGPSSPLGHVVCSGDGELERTDRDREEAVCSVCSLEGDLESRLRDEVVHIGEDIRRGHTGCVKFGRRLGERTEELFAVW